MFPDSYLYWQLESQNAILMTSAKSPILFLLLCLFAVECFAQQTVSDKVASLSHAERSKIKQPLYEFLHTWNTAASELIPAEKALRSKRKDNKRKGKDPLTGTKKLQETYDELFALDGTERSFIAETFALPMEKELEAKDIALDASDIYAAQYVIKFTLGVPKFNHGKLDINDNEQMKRELTLLIETFPDNDAHNQEIDGHIIDIFREEAQSFYNAFVAENKAEYLKGQGKKNGESYVTGSTTMNCGEKYEYLKKKGIMH